MAGGFIAGAGNEAAALANSEISHKQQSALELKLMSAKLEGEHQNRIQEHMFAQQEAQKAEQEKYARESKISKGVTDIAGKILGSDLTGATINDKDIIDSAMKLKLQREQQGRTPYFVKDEVGINQYVGEQNGLGVTVGSLKPASGYNEKRAEYDKLTTYTNMMSQAHQLYKKLAVHNALGGGSFLNRLPEELIKDRESLNIINDKLSKIEPATIEGVNRFSMELAQHLKPGQLLGEHTTQVESDLFHNAMLRSYSKIRNLGDTAKMPQELLDKFGGLTHDQSGHLINANDITIMHGDVYYAGNPEPVGNINSPFLSVHPHAAQSFAKHVADKASQATVGQGGFGSSDDFQAFLSADNKKK